MFGSDHYGIQPDLITIAKGLTSAYAPLSGVDRLRQGLAGAGTRHRRARRRSAMAGPIRRIRSARPPASPISKLDRRARPRRATPARPAPISAPRSPTPLGDHPNVGDVRGEGMLAAVEFVEDRDDRVFFDPARKVGPHVAAALLARGVIGRAMPQGDILGFAPPLCLTREEADRSSRPPPTRSPQPWAERCPASRPGTAATLRVQKPSRGGMRDRFPSHRKRSACAYSAHV